MLLVLYSDLMFLGVDFCKYGGEEFIVRCSLFVR